MRESFWGMMIVFMGITSMFLVFFFQSITNTNEHNYALLKETTQAAMFDALDIAAYRVDGTVRINREVFVESFLRRFAQNATLSHQYLITIYDVNETPPKVSITIRTIGAQTGTTIGNQEVTFTITNHIDAILETKW